MSLTLCLRVFGATESALANSIHGIYDSRVNTRASILVDIDFKAGRVEWGSKDSDPGASRSVDVRSAVTVSRTTGEAVLIAVCLLLLSLFMNFAEPSRGGRPHQIKQLNMNTRKALSSGALFV